MHTKLNIYTFINTSVIRSAFKRNFARRNKTALSPGDRKNRKIPRKWGKKINACIKCLWLRLCVPSEIHMPLIGSPGPGPMYRLHEPPSHRPWWYVIRTSKELRNWDFNKRNNSGHLCHRYSRYLTKLWCRQLYH